MSPAYKFPAACKLPASTLLLAASLSTPAAGFAQPNAAPARKSDARDREITNLKP